MLTTNFNEWLELQEAARHAYQRDVGDVIHPSEIREGDVIINRPSAFFSKVQTGSGRVKRQIPKLSAGDTDLSTFRVTEVTPKGLGAQAILSQRHANARTKLYPSEIGRYLDVSDAFSNFGNNKTKYLLYDPLGKWQSRYRLWAGNTKSQITTAPELAGVRNILGGHDAVKQDIHQQARNVRQEVGQDFKSMQQRAIAGEDISKFFKGEQADEPWFAKQAPREIIDALRFRNVPVAGVEPMSRQETTLRDELTKLDGQLSAIKNMESLVKPAPPPELMHIVKDGNAHYMSQILGLRGVQNFVQAAVGHQNDPFSKLQMSLAAPAQAPKAPPGSDEFNALFNQQPQQSQEPMMAMRAWSDPSIGGNGFYFKTFQESSDYGYLPTR